MENNYWEFKTNDIVTCKLRDGFIVSRSDENFSDTITLKVIGVKFNPDEEDDYVVFVPEYELARLQTQARVNNYICNEFKIEKRFLGDSMAFIRVSNVTTVIYRADGETCCNCYEFFEKAASNNDDGSFTCYSCCQNPWH